jgi:phosphoglycerate kinase
MLSLQIPNNSTILVRVDYNLSNMKELFRITSSYQTIHTLLEQGHKVILITHYGRPQAQEEEYSTKNLIEVVQEVFGTQPYYINQFQSFSQAKEEIKNNSQRLFILENTRFSGDETSKITEAKENLAKQYSQLGDYFIDEAFSVSHRQEATNYYLKNCMESSYGYRYQLEITNLNQLKSPKSPYILIMGGSKVETKLPLISHLITQADRILIGGMICFTFLEAAARLKVKIPPLWDSPVQQSSLDEVTELLKQHSNKIVLPIDLIYKTENGKITARDLGPMTTQLFINQLDKAQTIFWNGTLGQVEDPTFRYSTDQIINKLTSLDQALIIAGGGDTESYLTEEQKSKLDFVSTGGGACLEYIAHK